MAHYRSEYRQWRDEINGERAPDWWRSGGMAARLGSIVLAIFAGYKLGHHFGWLP